jgi:hypothetical protein
VGGLVAERAAIMIRAHLLHVIVVLVMFGVSVVSLGTASVQEKSQMIVRPAIVPDSLAKKFTTQHVDMARVRRNWDKLKKGQTDAEVRKLLGLPAIVHIDGVNGWTVWWYGKRSVAFNSVTNRLSHWDQILDH